MLAVLKIGRNLPRRSALLVGETTGGGFETLGGDKTHCFISRNKKLTILKSLQYTPSLSLFLASVSLYSLHTE
jgi:hypothetical protein